MGAAWRRPTGISPASTTGRGKGSSLMSSLDWSPRRLLEGPYIDAMALLDKQAVLDLGGYSTELIDYGWFGWEDYDLWLKLAQAGRSCRLVPRIVAGYRDHGASMLRRTNRSSERLARYFTTKFAALLSQHPGLDTHFAFPAGDHEWTTPEQAEIARLREHTTALERQLADVYTSKSWQVTSPLRAALGWFGQEQGEPIGELELVRPAYEVPAYDTRARRCLAASKSTTPAATETLRLSTWPPMGMDTRRSHDSRTSLRIPLPSAPSTMAEGDVQSIDSYDCVASPARPTTQTFCCLSSSIARAMLTTSATGTCETAPAEALAATVSSAAAWRVWRMTPCAPEASTLRRIAPTLCGSSMPSSTTSSAGPSATCTSSATL